MPQNSNGLQNTPNPSVEALNPRQGRLLAALLSEPTITDACAKSRIPESTAFLWLRDPVFAAAYREARREALAQATSQLCAAAGEAVQRLRDVMNDDEASPAARVSAARTILETAVKAVEVDDLVARLSVVEKILAGLPQPAASGHIPNGAAR